MDETPATPKPITRKRPIRYPRQIVIMATEDTYQAVASAAAAEDESKSVVARRWLDAGRAVIEAAAQAVEDYDPEERARDRFLDEQD